MGFGYLARLDEFLRDIDSLWSLDPRLLRQKPAYAVPVGTFFVLLGFFCAWVVFPAEFSFTMVAFSSLLLLPYVIKIFEFDELDIDVGSESKEELEIWVKRCLRDGFSPQQIKNSIIKDNINKPYDLLDDLTGIDEMFLRHVKASNFLSRHGKTIEFYVFLFVGMFVGYLLIWLTLGNEFGALAFKDQLKVITPSPTGDFMNPQAFQLILNNNLRIMLICIILSFFYGSGSILILNYNASVAGVLYGGSLGPLIGVGSLAFLTNPFMYIPHTMLEIFAYLMAAISGGILAKATMTGYEGMRGIFVKDGLLLAVTSIFLIVLGALVEVFLVFGG